MYTKTQIFNLALGALLLSRRTVNADTDSTNEVVTLRTHWDAALAHVLGDMDLDSTATQAALTLIEDYPEDFPEWTYVYRHPSNCAKFRRIKSCQIMDDRDSHIPKLIRIYDGEKAIFTNEVEAIGEMILTNIDIGELSAPAGLALAYHLAFLSSPLIVGKGAKKLMDEIYSKYLVYKASAQELDQDENFNFTDPANESEFVKARQS